MAVDQFPAAEAGTVRRRTPRGAAVAVERPQVDVSISVERPPQPEFEPSRKLRRNEFLRKLLHISPGFLAFLLPYAPHTKPLSGQALFELTVITAFLTGLYIALRRFVARPGESDFYVTTLSYPAAVLGTLFAFPHAPELAAVVVVVIAFGDGAAYLGGKRIGGPRLPWNPTKTWAGTLTFVLVAGPLASLAYLGEAGWETPWPLGFLCGGGAALLAAAAESLPTRLSDNLRVGATATITAATLHYAGGPYFLS